jgi:hypothetical protein
MPYSCMQHQVTVRILKPKLACSSPTTRVPPQVLWIRSTTSCPTAGLGAWVSKESVPAGGLRHPEVQGQ